MNEFLSRLGGAALADLKGTPLDTIINRLLGGQPGASGLQGLVDRLRNGGLTDRVESWIGTGENRPVAPPELERALGSQETDRLAQEAGMEKPGLLALLSQMLPGLVDSLTPQGHMPKPGEPIPAATTAGERHPGIGAGGEAGMPRLGPAPAPPLPRGDG